MRWKLLLLLNACALLAWRVPTRGQAIDGKLLDASTGRPIDAAFILLLDDHNARRAAALTDSAGRFVLRAPSPGRYTLRAERIGYRSSNSAPIDLTGSGQLPYTMRVSVEALQLAGITARGRRR